MTSIRQEAPWWFGFEVPTGVGDPRSGYDVTTDEAFAVRLAHATMQALNVHSARADLLAEALRTRPRR